MARRTALVLLIIMMILASGCTNIIQEAEQLIEQVDLPIIRDIEEYL
jgi:hypothetical protein